MRQHGGHQQHEPPCMPHQPPCTLGCGVDGSHYYQPCPACWRCVAFITHVLQMPLAVTCQSSSTHHATVHDVYSTKHGSPPPPSLPCLLCASRVCARFRRPQGLPHTGEQAVCQPACHLTVWTEEVRKVCPPCWCWWGPACHQGRLRPPQHPGAMQHGPWHGCC